jgi:hypothetical protein
MDDELPQTLLRWNRAEGARTMGEYSPLWSVLDTVVIPAIPDYVRVF